MKPTYHNSRPRHNKPDLRPKWYYEVHGPTPNGKFLVNFFLSKSIFTPRLKQVQGSEQFDTQALAIFFAKSNKAVEKYCK